MSKRMKTVWKDRKRNSRGFTILELIVAIAILGVISGVVGYMMTTSSKTYSSLSSEALLQSEAQLVANSINELAVDAYDASDKLDGAIDMEFETGDSASNYDFSDGKVLVLSSRLDGVKSQHLIFTKPSKQELYYSRRTYSEVSSSWSKYSSPALLGDCVTGFKPISDKVENENILSFELDYTLDKRTYKGNYQVLMRNRAYADEEEKDKNNNVAVRLLLGLSPKTVYLDVVDGKIQRYYEGSVALGNQRTATKDAVTGLYGIEFKSDVICSTPLNNRGVKWTLSGADSAYKMAVDSDTEVKNNTLVLSDDENVVRGSAVEEFSIVISKTINAPDGSGQISAQNKMARILVRRVRGLTINATGGCTQWISQYTDDFNGQPTAGAQGYAYTDASGKYRVMHINASIAQSNIPYGGGVMWKLERKDPGSSNWVTCGEAYAKLLVQSDETGTTNSITFGPAAQNGQLYKVTATSIFDPSVSGEFYVGVAPEGAGNNEGFNSRGFYVDLTSYIKTQPGYENAVIEKVRKGAVGGVFDERSDIRVEQGVDGRWYLYVSYDAYKGSGTEKSMFYSRESTIDLYITQHEKSEDTKALQYSIKPVIVTKISPKRDVIVLRKGATKDVSVQTNYYNVVDDDYFGVYLENMDKRINTSGLSGSNKYLAINVSTKPGDAHTYVDKMTTSLTAKSDTRDYNANPLRLRLTADDYYETSSHNDANAYTDYMVYVANVTDAEVFIPTPDTDEGGCTWPVNVGERAVNVNGYDATGNLVTDIASVYTENNRYKCKYKGSIYTYNRTYHYWYK